MRQYPLEKTRNIGIIAHIDAGKTTTTETLLYLTGKTYKIGTIDEGTTQMDWMEQERERGITITSAATTCFWRPKDAPSWGEHQINIIDTPGHIDFTAEVQRSLRVLDAAVVVFDGKAGVEPQSETVWRQADNFRVPRLCYINKLNLTGGDFYLSLSSIRDKLNPKAVALQIPIGAEKNLKGYVDLILMQAFVYENEAGQGARQEKIPANLLEKAQTFRQELIEKAAEFDNELLEKYLEGKEVSVELLRRAVRRGTVAGQLFPVLGGDARKGLATSLLDAIVEYLPSPLDLPSIRGTNPKTGEEVERKASDEEPFSSLAFKIVSDPYVGTLTYFRVYSGKLPRGSYVLNTTTGEKERIGRILRMHANQREEVAEIYAGEIAATVGLKNTTTGNTLCEENAPIVLEDISFPEPVMGVRIEPKTRADQEKMSLALKKLAEEDPTFKIKRDAETNETIISGMGELHLEILVDRMKREFKMEANVGQPQVAYKETIRKKVEAEGKYIRQTGGRGQYGHVWLRVEPRKRGEGFEFIDEIKGGIIPKTFIPAVKKGIKQAIDKGILAGYPVVDVGVALYDGSFHEVDSSDIAFQIAGFTAFVSAVRRADPALLEPMMRLEVIVPEKFLGDTIGDLNARRGKVKEMSDRLNLKAIFAEVPLAKMFGYSTALRSLTQGRGTFTMEFDHYQEMPQNISQEIIMGRKT